MDIDMQWASRQIRKLRVTHAPGMPGTFSPPPRASDPDMHHGTCGAHVPWYMPGSLTSGFLWSRWRGKHSRRMRNPQSYVSGKKPVDTCVSAVRSQLVVNCIRWLEHLVHIYSMPHDICTRFFLHLLSFGYVLWVLSELHLTTTVLTLQKTWSWW